MELENENVCHIIFKFVLLIERIIRNDLDIRKFSCVDGLLLEDEVTREDDREDDEDLEGVETEFCDDDKPDILSFRLFN